MEKKKNIRVTLVEDHADFREGLTQLIATAEGFTCVGVFGSAEDALEQFPQSDVVLLDIHLPGKSGIESIQAIKKVCPSAQIVMMTVFDDDDNIFNAILSGADGYLLKKTPPAKILTALEDAATGGSSMTPFVARRVLEAYKSRADKKEESSDALSNREQEVLKFLVQGFNYKQIAEQLFISPETVRNHIRNTYEKLHVHSRSEAVAKAIKQGLVK